MTDRLSLYNGALLKLAQPRLVALNEEGKARRALDYCFDKVVKGCLEAGLWNFAMRFSEVETSPSVGSNYGYQYVFDKPDDWLRTAGIWEDGDKRSPLLDYDDRASHWLANRGVIYVQWVSLDEDYGLDLGLWPETFVDYVETVLAKTICVEITGSESKQEKLQQDEKKALSKASNRDAMNEAVTRFPPVGRLVRSRSASRFGRSREHG